MAAVVLSPLAMPTAWTTRTDIEALSNRKLREFILAAGLPVDGLVTKAELKVVAYEIQAKAAEEEGEGEGEDEGQGEGEGDWSDSWEAPLSEPFCLHAILGLTPTAPPPPGRAAANAANSATSLVRRLLLRAVHSLICFNRTRLCITCRRRRCCSCGAHCLL